MIPRAIFVLLSQAFEAVNHFLIFVEVVDAINRLQLCLYHVDI
jgi:hypothetical protein